MFLQDENLLNTHNGADETEMLQTDIQRFLAILAFCLLPVFMLVQSIPVVSQKKDPVIENHPRRFKEQAAEFNRISKKNKGLKELETGSDKQPVKGEKGLYVAFESDRVFLDLLEAQRIQLFIHIAGVKQSFRVTGRAGSVHFEPGNSVEDLDLWEIKKIMVPGEILDAFRQWTTLASREMMFIVGLSPDLSRQIRERGRQGGRILISEGGKVHFQAHGE